MCSCLKPFMEDKTILLFFFFYVGVLHALLLLHPERSAAVHKASCNPTDDNLTTYSGLVCVCVCVLGQALLLKIKLTVGFLLNYHTAYFH